MKDNFFVPIFLINFDKFPIQSLYKKIYREILNLFFIPINYKLY